MVVCSSMIDAHVCRVLSIPAPCMDGVCNDAGNRILCNDWYSTCIDASCKASLAYLCKASSPAYISLICIDVIRMWSAGLFMLGFIAFPMPELFPRHYWLFHSLWHVLLAAGYYQLYALIEAESLAAYKEARRHKHVRGKRQHQANQTRQSPSVTETHDTLLSEANTDVSDFPIQYSCEALQVLNHPRCIHIHFAESTLVGKYAQERAMTPQQLACFDNVDASNKGNMTGCPWQHPGELTLLGVQAQDKRQAVGQPSQAHRIQADTADSDYSSGTEFDAAEAKCGLDGLRLDTLLPPAIVHRKKV